MLKKTSFIITTENNNTAEQVPRALNTFIICRTTYCSFKS